MGMLIANNENISNIYLNKLSFGNWTIYHDSTEGYQFRSIIKEQRVLFYYGYIYDERWTEPQKIFDQLQKSGESSIFEIDGEFIFGIIGEDKCIIYSDREGLIPLYYSAKRTDFMVTTDVSILFQNYVEADIDYTAINDFLRFGMLIGNKTFANSAKLLEYGSKLSYTKGKVNFTRIYLYSFAGEKFEDEDALIDSLVNGYQKAIYKRLCGNGSQTCVFLSGGIDSRFLLACLNEIAPEKVKTVSFGQPCSEETMIALQCAKVRENEFEWQVLTPDKFIESAEEYIRLTCGMDMFPQSYILNVARQAQYKQFYTGFAMDVYLGGTFIDEEAIACGGKLSDFIESNLKLVKMVCLSESVLKRILRPEIRDMFMGLGSGYLKQIASEYDGLSVKDSLQPFATKNRAVRLVMLRDLSPGRFVNYINPSVDLEFQNIVKRIPVESRLNHKLYQKLMCKKFSDYADIPYNNTTLPVSFSVDLWKEGAKREYERELVYERVMMSGHPNISRKVYYPHYYSDFNGYSRYDETWRQLFLKYLLDENLFIYEKLFDCKEISQIYKEHVSGQTNWRKEIIAVTTLSMFLELFLKNRR